MDFLDISCDMLFELSSNVCFVFDHVVVASFMSGQNTMSAHESVDEVLRGVAKVNTSEVEG